MRIELNPIICWLTQESDEPYQESLDRIVDSLRAPAARYLERYLPGDGSSRPEWLVYSTLGHLQNLILDQYLPVLEPGRSRVVSCIWPRWEALGMTVRLKDGGIALLTPPFPADRQPMQQPFDGRMYEFTFYRNDLPEQRMRWLLYEMSEWAHREGRRERPRKETPLEEMEAGVVEAEFAGEVEDADFLKKLRSIADPEDIGTALASRNNEDAAARKRRQRAMQRLITVGQIIQRVPRCKVARTYFDRLKAAATKDRRRILEEYSARFPKGAAANG